MLSRLGRPRGLMNLRSRTLTAGIYPEVVQFAETNCTERIRKTTAIAEGTTRLLQNSSGPAMRYSARISIPAREVRTTPKAAR